MIRIAIVDDEQTARQLLSGLVNDYFANKAMTCSISLFTNGMDFLQQAEEFDLVFLDIQMDGISGMEAAKRLRQKGISSFCVFVTVLTEYVYEAFEVEASDYLIKPIASERFCHTMDRVCGKIQRLDTKDLLISWKGNLRRLLPLRDIVYIEAVNHRIEISTEHETCECGMKMTELAEQLDHRFFQCHRSYFINLDFVCGYDKGEVTLINSLRIPVSRLRRLEFMEAMMGHMKAGGGL